VVPPAWAPPVLAATLVASGVLVLQQVGQSRRRRLADRIALVAPKERPSGTEFSEAEAPQFLSDAARAVQTPELLAAARLCRRLRVPVRHTAAALMGARAAAALALVAAAAATLHLGADDAMRPLKLLLVLALGVSGFFAPVVLLRRGAAARRRKVTRGLPDALELLVVCVEAGLALEDSLDRVTAELRANQPALAEELRITAADLKVLPDRNQAFAKLAERVDTPAIRSVVTTLSQTLRYGTPLAGALRTAAAELRNDALLSLEESAGSLPTLMTVPLIVCILPTMFLIVGGPAILRLIDIFAQGR
jgi:tight adherence protein C